MMHYRLFFPLILLILVSGCGTTTPQPNQPTVKPEPTPIVKQAPRVQVQKLSAPENLEAILIQPQEIKPIKAVALLPLSGRYQAAGKSIQTGLIEAYYQAPSEHSLFFLDSAELTQTSLNAYIEKHAIDAVIGPLVKDTIQRLEVPQTIEQLSLNTHSTRP